MKINITGRQFEITASIREYVEQQINAMVEDKALSITSVNVVMDREKNRFQTSIVVNCKYHTVPSVVTDFDLYKSFDAALLKVDTQLKTLREKIRTHQVVPLCDSEVKKAEEA